MTARGRARLGSAVRLSAVLVAGGLIALEAPMPVRALFAAPVLVLLAGDALVRLLVGSDPVLAGDRLVRPGLVPVLGLLLVLGVLLVENATGRALTGSLLTLTLTGLTLLLVLAGSLAETRSGPGSGGRSPAESGSSRAAVTLGLGLLLTSALLIGALAAAQAMRPPLREDYAVLAFTQADRFGESPIVVAPNGGVTIGLGLAGYGTTLPGDVPQTSVTVGDDAAAGLDSTWFAVQTDDPFGDGSTAERRGRVDFRAPATPGLYRIRIGVPDPVGGATLLLTTDLRVRG